MSLRRLLELVVCALALFAIGAYVWLGAHRVGYPVEVDFIEGVMLDHVARIAHGQPIYVAPSLQFIPLAYMPLFTTVSGLVMRLTGPGFFAMRIVSFSSSLLLAALIAIVVLRETRRPVFALAAAGVYAMAFGLTGACYDVGRPDSMMLLLSFGGLAVLRYSRGAAGAVGAAGLLTLGFFTKQHSVLFSFGALAYLFFHERRRFLPFAAAIVTGCLGGYLLLAAWLGEWFRYFTWSVPSGWSEVNPARIERYLGGGLFGALACSSAPALLSLAVRDENTDPRRALWYWTGFAAVGTGLLATLDRNAYLHVFTPTVVALAILGPLALDRLLRAFESATAARGVAAAAVLAVLAGQFVPLVYPIRLHIPRPHARQAHDQLIRRLRSLPNGAILPYHGWYDLEAGGRGSLQFIALDDILRSHGNSLLKRDPTYLERMFAPLAAGPGRPAIVTDVPLEHSGPLWRRIAPGYALVDSLGDISKALVPLTGNQHSLTYLYLPVGPAGGAPAK
ncbi:MAG: hypothetical protein IT347_14600 [Candidatus Eisenbacteria bacterium]|nr:hypothetical protein [Candidatus Eisenbacteria bacterium]